jgi:predicted RNA-binding Zn-ribbon protein involved in translation (DUF1610 family)
MHIRRNDMVERMFCTKCKEVSYTMTHNVDAPCPYCGFDIKWKSVGRKLFKRGEAESSLPPEWRENFLSPESIRG